ncbi:MAG: metallophosphoesterase [Planctomycetes bacterium]|nr:metallophosphoesterase [Planctomycetota bacterium]
MSQLLLLCMADVVALVAAAAVALRARPRTAWRELATMLSFGLVAGLGLGVLQRPFGNFAVLRGFAHAISCVILPVWLLRAVVLRRRHRWLAGALVAAFVVGEGCYLWAREVEPFRLEVTTHVCTSEKLRGLERPLCIACVADLQTDAIGAYEVSVFDRLVELQPDLVLFLGDYLQLEGEELAAELPKLRAQLQKLSPPLGMFAVEGDVDWPAGDAAGVYEGTAVRALDDGVASLHGVPIDLIGLGRRRSRLEFADAGLLRRAGAQGAGARFPIVFGHAPDFMQSVLRGGLDLDCLMLAGHTHGGQIQVPGFGPVMTLSSVPRWLAGGGVFPRGRAWLGVSRGVGMERGHAPRVRFCCRPQLMVIELGPPRDDSPR